MWAFGQEYLSLNISNTLALGMGLNSGLDYIYCAWILNGGCSPIAPYLYSIYVCGVHARGGHCMSSSFFGTVIFCAPSVYAFSHGVGFFWIFFLDFFFGFFHERFLNKVYTIQHPTLCDPEHEWHKAYKRTTQSEN